jgi:hypothetical protein
MKLLVDVCAGQKLAARLRLAGYVFSILAGHSEDLARGALITVERHRIRVREPE